MPVHPVVGPPSCPQATSENWPGPRPIAEHPLTLPLPTEPTHPGSPGRLHPRSPRPAILNRWLRKPTHSFSLLPFTSPQGQILHAVLPSPPSTFAESAKQRATDERPNSLLRRSRQDSGDCRPSLTRTETGKTASATRAALPGSGCCCGLCLSPSTQPGGRPSSLTSTSTRRRCPVTVNFHLVRIFALSCFPLRLALFWSVCPGRPHFARFPTGVARVVWEPDLSVSHRRELDRPPPPTLVADSSLFSDNCRVDYAHALEKALHSEPASPTSLTRLGRRHAAPTRPASHLARLDPIAFHPDSALHNTYQLGGSRLTDIPTVLRRSFPPSPNLSPLLKLLCFTTLR